METVVLVTGGFDPLHSGHIEYIKSAKCLGDFLIVGLNSDEWLARKKGRSFMPWVERASVISELKSVDRVINFDDSDGTAKDAVRKTRDIFPDSKIIFANGGDRTAVNIPEMDIADDNIKFAFGVGSEDKRNSSSWILEEWKAPKTLRPWGYYRMLHDVPGMKVKELTIDPGKSLSMQRHWLRNEYWIVQEGTAVINSQTSNGYAMPPKTLYKYNEHHVPMLEWHQLTNPFPVPLRIVEIQYGEKCVEEDIERK